MMKRQLIIILAGVFLLLFLQLPAWGMDTENPANLALPGTHFELAVPVGLSGGNNLFNLGNINLDMTDPAVKEEFLGLMEKGYFKLNADAELNPSITIGRFQLEARPWVGATICLAPGWTDFLFKGYEPNKEYVLDGTIINGIAAASLDLSYGHPLLIDEPYSLGLGVTFHYLQGLAIADMEITKGKIVTDDLAQAQYETEGTGYTNIQIPENPSGNIAENFSLPLGESTGYTLDLGIVYKNDRLTSGLAIKNIGPGIHWKGITQWTGSASGTLDGGPLGPTVGPDNTSQGERQDNIELTTPLPLVLNLTADYKLIPRHINLHFGFEKGFEDGWGISSTPRYSAGLDLETLRIIRFAGEIGYRGKQFDFQTMAELRLFFLWINAKVGWTGDCSSLQNTTGLSAAATVKIHF